MDGSAEAEQPPASTGTLAQALRSRGPGWHTDAYDLKFNIVRSAGMHAI